MIDYSHKVVIRLCLLTVSSLPRDNDCSADAVINPLRPQHYPCWLMQAYVCMFRCYATPSTTLTARCCICICGFLLRSHLRPLLAYMMGFSPWTVPRMLCTSHSARAEGYSLINLILLFYSSRKRPGTLEEAEIDSDLTRRPKVGRPQLQSLANNLQYYTHSSTTTFVSDRSTLSIYNSVFSNPMRILSN